MLWLIPRVLSSACLGAKSAWQRRYILHVVPTTCTWYYTLLQLALGAKRIVENLDAWMKHTWYRAGTSMLLPLVCT